MPVKLETRGLGKRYRDALALSPTDLQVEEGEFLTLLGPSGSGKTTLLQLIAGLVEPTQGRLFINGRDATRLPPGERGVGMVFQSYALFPHLTVAENVAYPLRMRRRPRAEIATEVENALRMVRMVAFAHRFPRELSGGQQQRVALARCFVYRPQVILLDEPLGALDKKLREHMQLEIRRLHKELGGTFIYVTHDQEEALTLSDRICLMNHARVEQVGTPLEIYDRPVSRFAADFIGHSNILDGSLQLGANGAAMLRMQDTLLPIPAVPVETAESLSLLVRPEIARLTDPARGYLRGTVTEIVFTGSDFRALVDIPGVGEFAIRCPRHAAPAPNAVVGIEWDAATTTLLTR